MKVKAATSLTRRNAWLIIRHAFRNWTPYESGPQANNKLDNFGLCNAVTKLRAASRITSAVYIQMRRDIERMKPPGAYAYYWRCTEVGARERVAAITKRLKSIKA